MECKQLLVKQLLASFIWLGCILFHGLASASDVKKNSYQWGRGYHIPALNLTLGGYTKVAYSYFERTPQQAALDDLSLFISWQPFSRLHLFSELELSDLFSSDEGVKPFNQSFLVERLYADILVNDNFTVRFGKYLTPFSRWNLLHAAPLVWTSSRPIVTRNVILTPHSSGLAFQYNTLLFGRELKTEVYADDSQDLDIKRTLDSFKYAFGTRLTYQVSDTLNLGLSYVANKRRASLSKSWQHLIGLDFLWQKNQYEVMFESFLNTSIEQPDHYGLYLQGVIPVPLLKTLFLVGRYEYIYKRKRYPSSFFTPKSVHIGVIGLTWRPATPIALKVEYRMGKNNFEAPSGFLSSIALFF